jgi:hypothetical protein
MSSLCDGYTDAVYAIMTNDSIRTEAYRRTIEKYVRGRVVMDIGTGADALLAKMCVEAGASFVYGVEKNHHAFLSAQQNTRGIKNICIIEGYSTEIQNSFRNDEDIQMNCIEIFVHEIFGEIASREGVVFVMRDAFQRFLCKKLLQGLAPFPISIPHASRTLVTPGIFPPIEYWESQQTPCIIPPSITFLSLPQKPPEKCLLSHHWEILEEIIFDTNLLSKFDGECERQLQWIIEKDGIFSGLLAKMQVCS